MLHSISPKSRITPESALPNFLTVQALRAVAALLVVVFHTVEVWGDRIDPHALGTAWENGAAGVDIFFVISGFVMVVAAQRLSADPAGWITFLRHRIVRIVPLYWLLTTVKLAAVLTLPALAIRTSIDASFVSGSYLFLPVIDHAGNFRPLIPMGWTLTYELLFYIFFAIALALRTDILRVTLPALGAIAILALLRDGTWPAWTILFSTIVLEFIFGVLLAKLTLTGFRLSPRTAFASMAAGVIAVLALPMVSDNMRVVMWGLPSLAVVAGAVSLESIIARKLPHWLLTLGDASYSIYLSHGFVVPLVILAIGKTLPNVPATEFLAVLLCLVLSASVGWIVYIVIEHPMFRAMRPRRSATVARPLSTAGTKAA